MTGFHATDEADLQRLSGSLLLNGPAFSGKSALISRIADPLARTLLIGAGDTSDPGIAARVKDLRSQRPSHWEHASVQLDLAAQIRAGTEHFEQIIVDAINPWLARTFFAAYDTHHDVSRAGEVVYGHLSTLCTLITQIPQTKLLIVSADMTSSLSPNEDFPRMQRELSGRAVQHLGRHCHHVVQMLAGWPVLLHSKSV